MIILNKPINLIVWEYASVPVEVIFDSLSHIDSVYCINSTNAGFVSFKPNQSFNTLQLLESYKTYIVVLKSASYTINYSQPIVQLDKPKAGYVSGNVDLIEYLGSNTNISLLPQALLDKLKTIYSLNSTGNGFISYNTSSPFNTLSQLKNNTILIVEKTDNQTITFFDTQTDFPNSSKPDVNGPKYCSYPDVWRISSDNEYYCYNPDVNNVDIADVEPSIEQLFLPLQNNASLIDVQDCPGDQKLGLIALNGNNRFVDFAECGDYADLPIEVPDLSTLQGGTVFETLTAMKVTALNHLLKNVSNQLSTINSSINIISRQINSLDRQLTKLSNDLDDNWQAYIALQTSLNDETDSQNISDIQTLIGQKQNIINQIQESIETKNITRQNSQNVFNNLSNEATSLNQQQNNIKSAISNPALTNTLFPEIESSVLSSISDATNGMGFVSPVSTTPYVPVIGSYCLNNQCVSGSYDDWEAAVNINPIQSIGQWVPENCSASVQCVGNSREFSILSDNTCSNPTLKISSDNENLSIKTRCPSASSFYGNDLWLACQVNRCGSSDTSTVLVTVSSIGSNNLPSNYYVTATGGVRQGSSDSGVITLGSLSGSGNAFSIPVTYCCAKSPGSVSVPITFRAIDNTTGKILGRSEIRVVGTAEQCHMDGRYETGPCCHEFTPGIRTCGIRPYEICYNLTGNEKSFLKPDFDYFPSANNGPLVPTRIQKTCDDFDPPCGTTTAGPCPCPNSVDTAWFGTRCSCKPPARWYPCINGCTLYDSQGNVIANEDNTINKGVCLRADQIRSSNLYEWYPGGPEEPCAFRCKSVASATPGTNTLPNIKSCQDDVDWADGQNSNMSAYFFNFSTCNCECNKFRLGEPCTKGNLENYLQFHPTDSYRVILGTIGKPEQLQKEKPNTYPKEKFSKNFGDKTRCDCQCMFLQGNDYIEGSQSICEALLQHDNVSTIEFSESVCACSAKKLGACCDRFSRCYDDKTSTQCDDAGDIWHINKKCDAITCEPTTTTTTTTTAAPALIGSCCRYNPPISLLGSVGGSRIDCEDIYSYQEVSVCEDDPCAIFVFTSAFVPVRDCQDRTNPFYADESFYCPESKLLPNCGTTTLPPTTLPPGPSGSCCLTWVPCPDNDSANMIFLYPINICKDDQFGVPTLNTAQTCNENFLNNNITNSDAQFYGRPANEPGVTWTAHNVQFTEYGSCENNSCTTPSPAFSCLEKEIVTNVSVFNANAGLGASNNEKLQTPQIIMKDGQPSILIEVTLTKIRATGSGILPTPQGLGQEISSASINGEGSECCKTPVLNIEPYQNKSYVGYSIISNRTISEFFPVNDCPS